MVRMIETSICCPGSLEYYTLSLSPRLRTLWELVYFANCLHSTHPFLFCFSFRSVLSWRSEALIRCLLTVLSNFKVLLSHMMLYFSEAPKKMMLYFSEDKKKWCFIRSMTSVLAQKLMWTTRTLWVLTMVEQSIKFCLRATNSYPCLHQRGTGGSDLKDPLLRPNSWWRTLINPLVLQSQWHQLKWLHVKRSCLHSRFR